tara:strand:+ start:1014 stop:1226 length:213 start_codon:yes stop_codon:yes gene_type:complete
MLFVIIFSKDKLKKWRLRKLLPLIKNHEKYYEIKKLIPETKLEKLYFKNSNHFSDYGHIEIAKILINILK